MIYRRCQEKKGRLQGGVAGQTGGESKAAGGEPKAAGGELKAAEGGASV